MSCLHFCYSFEVKSASVSLCVCPKQNDVDPTKAAPVLNSSKADSTSAAKPSSMALEDTEMRKLMEECKRLQSEVSKLGDENRQLKVEEKKELNTGCRTKHLFTQHEVMCNSDVML